METQKTSFKIGDVVQLKSGSPLMTIRIISENQYKCVWFNTSTNKFETSELMPFAILQRAKLTKP